MTANQFYLADKASSFIRKYSELIGGSVVLVGLYLTSLYRYVLFHSLAEVFSIVVACGVFMVYWNSRRFLSNDYFLFVGIAYLCVGCLDLLHTLAYKGMGVFPTNDGNLANQLWIAARYLESLSLLAACIFLHRRLNVHLVATGYAVVFALILGSIFFWGIFPDCFIDGVGVTAFKTVSEIVICGILGVSIVLLVRRKADFDQHVFCLLLGSLIVTIASELSFSYYTNPYGPANLIGHLFKLVSFYLLYKAFIKEGLKRPHDLIFREMRCNEQTLRQHKEEVEALYLKLAKKQEFLNAVLDNIRDGIVACDADGMLTLFNPTTREFHGIPEMSIPAEDWPQHFDLYLPDGTTLMRKEDVPLYRALQGETVQNSEMVIAPKQGMPRFLLVDGRQLIVDGKLVGAVAVLHDITENRQAIAARKRAEEMVRASEKKYRTYINNSPAGVFVTDLTGHYMEVNASACRLLGYSETELTQLGISDIVAPEDVQSAMTAFYELLHTGSAVNAEFCFVRKDGSRFFMSVDAVKVREDRVIGFCLDITKRINAERSLKQQSESLQQSNQKLKEAHNRAEAASRSKSEFLANMSHEIRTPMTAILGFADILLEDLVTDEAIESAQIIKRNGAHLLNLINDILDLSKIEAGKYTADFQKCSPGNIAAEVISLMKVRSDAKGLMLTFEVRGDIPENITTDPIRLRQSLINLIGNSIKFTEVGSVRVVMRLDAKPNGESKLAFDVIDTGIGMSEEQMGLLFRPFSQVDGSATRRFGGTGLGLAISKRMAELLGGDISVRSSPGQGSMFSLSIGIGNMDESAMIQPSKVVTAREPVGNAQQKLNCRILLAEDGPDNQRLIAFLLRKAGAVVELAENGQIALDLALTAQQVGNPFDVILMDMQMPVMDGYQSTQKLRSAGYKEPIIALTAHAMTEDRQKCIDAGCDDYITKPIDPKKLVGLIEPWLAREPSLV
ncbi:MAG: MASE3 domain-containing protein [Planctomycetota bacterium]